jgi:hypothetical protein
MRRVLAVAAALGTVLAITAVAVAAVAPGAYKGSLYQGAKKLANAPATVTVAGAKVTIKAPRLPVKCQAPDGTFTASGDPQAYEFKGTIKGNTVSGTYISPLGGTGEYHTAKGTFAPATKTFVGKLSFTGRCKGTATVRAKKG